MASVFTYDPNPPRVSSPWSTSGSTTPQSGLNDVRAPSGTSAAGADANVMALHVNDLGISRLEPEPQEGPIEYKLHLLLRPRRSFTASTTANLLSGSQHSKTTSSGGASPRPSPQFYALKSTPGPSHQTRQNRLQQLTTQLLWRLQQSSPFHSSSPGDLVLPLLPEATPKLGVPNKPARLLPGLEESQGALYEIGVSDDGVFLGLTHDELEESLVNLRAMAASLGCVVEVLRKVVVGECEWADPAGGRKPDARSRVSYCSELWVAEAIVRPDLESREIQSTSSQFDLPPSSTSFDGNMHHAKEESRSITEQLRISLTGASGSGKSSLLGTLTTGTLDNGRGKTRLGLLRHRHEIASGITSSVAQELIGYGRLGNGGSPSYPSAINYATGDVSSWNDIHSLTTKYGRLVFLSDSPGMMRFSKSTIRTLMSWNPHWVVICVSADDTDDRGTLSLTYLELCLKMELRIIFVITKIDLATKLGLRQTLARLLSTLKDAGRKPLVLSLNSAKKSDEALQNLQYINPDDLSEISRLLSAPDFLDSTHVPILFSSATTGAGVSKLHALLQAIPIPDPTHQTAVPANVSSSKVPIFKIDEVFSKPPSKVYSGETPSASTSMTTSSPIETPSHSGIVLCGHLAKGTLSIGQTMLLGPFRSDYEPDHLGSSATSREPFFYPVTILSLRNLRLPVRSLLPGQVGTIGIEAVPKATPSSMVGKTRKGMILTEKPLPTHTSFSALFPASVFETPESPPLILGGHALAYFSSVRAAVKVSAVSVLRGETENDEMSVVEDQLIVRAERDDDEDGLFAFDAHEENGTALRRRSDWPLERTGTSAHGEQQNEKQVKITFDFLGSVECCTGGEKVLIMPSTKAVGAGSSMVTTTAATAAVIGDGSPRPRSVSSGVEDGGGSGGGGATRGPIGFVGIMCEEA